MCRQDPCPVYIHAMRRTGRVLTILFSFLALQLSLLSGGPACMAAAVQAGGLSAVMGAGFGMPASAETDDHCAPPHRGSHAPAPIDQHCASMIICAIALDAPSSVTLADAASRGLSGVHGISERTPMSYIVAPELPPPRA